MPDGHTDAKAVLGEGRAARAKLIESLKSHVSILITVQTLPHTLKPGEDRTVIARKSQKLRLKSRLPLPPKLGVLVSKLEPRASVAKPAAATAAADGPPAAATTAGQLC